MTWDKMLVDAMTMRMVMRPQTIDTVLATNLHADILSDLAAALAGSLGIAPTANLNPERTFPSMFGPIHGSAFDIMGKGVHHPLVLKPDTSGDARAGRATRWEASNCTRAKMTNKRRVEVFSAGCALCHEVINAVSREAGSSREVIVRKMTDSRVLRRAEELGIRSVPAVVIDGKLVSGSGPGVAEPLCFLEAIANTVHRLDHIKFGVAGRELQAQPFDVAVNVSFIHIQRIVVAHIHQCIAALHHAGAAGQRMQKQKFGRSECYPLVFPGARMALRTSSSPRSVM